ncbi:MAG: exodeoxyribonuclease VII large subunit [Clostridia bacterium]|nr:exodeoxyribonuclease VII large subunit [Clostridia bacterium]
MNGMTITVKQLNTYVKSLIESDARLLRLSVAGEISNFKNHYSSGHWYFTLKDSEAQIRCVMFNSYAVKVPFAVEDGMRVVVNGRVSVYERDGLYQLYVESIENAGEGDLYAAFNRLKEKLKKEGLFAAEEKRPIKKIPEKIAVLTSDTGAAVRDIFNITSTRYPVCDILLCPVVVQGDNAPYSMINMLDRVYERDDVDTIIIGRGGGSLEDLWAFNNEALARKIYESPIPVISAVGHETDFTICDFVADVRASTPSHAAELAVPDKEMLFELISGLKTKLYSGLAARYNTAKAKYELASSGMLLNPLRYFDNVTIKVDGFEEKLKSSINRMMLVFDKRFSDAAARLDALSPLKIISRGFAAVSSGDGLIKSAKELSAGQNIALRFSDGDADCKVTEVRC